MGTFRRAIYTVGKSIRGTGQAMDRLGSTIQGGLRVEEQLSRHRTIMNIFEKEPRIHKDVFVAPSAAVIGNVEIGRGSSTWYSSILRGDVKLSTAFILDLEQIYKTIPLYMFQKLISAGRFFQP